MQPVIHLNWFAIAAAVLANIIIGFLWYGPILGKAWMREMGISPDHKPDPAVMKRSMIIMIVSAFLTATVLAHTVAVWRPSTWNAGTDAANAIYGFASAFFTWIGFFVPVLLAGVAWENKSLRLFGINAGYHFVALLAAGMILAFWR
ncbi:MAG: DUF1761 domain-containing protein [Burkholderiales bacterium]